MNPELAEEGDTFRLPPIPLLAGLALTMVCSVVLLWLIADSSLVAAAYAGALLCFIVLGLLIGRARANAEVEPATVPDWTVTVAAIEDPSRAIAVTDRANRLVCANSRYDEWFGAAHAPPDLPMGSSARDTLSNMVRQAWREGSGRAASLSGSRGVHGERRQYDIEVVRAGRGEDYLVWRFSENIVPRTDDWVAELLSGPVGKVLSRAGLEAALVNSKGRVEATTRGLAERALGGEKPIGREFVELLRVDERDHIFFAHEGQQGTPQRLVHVPLDPPGAAKLSNADEASSLMLLVDSGVGMGAGYDGDVGSARPQLEAMLSALPLGLALTDRDGRFLFGNKAFRRAVGHTGINLPAYPSDLVVREDKAALSDAVRRYARGATSSGDMALRLSSQPDDPVSIGLAGVRGVGDAAVLLSIADSTEEQRLRRQVAQATKMQAVGQLAGGVAHDFNNVLTAILGYCDLMLLRHTPGDSDYDDIQQIRANSNRAASLTRHLLAFSRQQTLRPEVLQLPDVVSEMTQLLKRLTGERIEFVVKHDRQLGPVRADPQQLEQVIMNLVVNARDAINSSDSGPGKLTMTTKHVSAKDVGRLGVDFMPADDYTTLIVQDTGGGIPPENVSKIFEPFFTTKEQGKGTGLGLSTVYGIVKQSNGFIFADNVMGANGKIEGARFSIYLPVHTGKIPKAERPITEQPQVSEWTGGAKLLLVEDEDMVRAVAERALVRAGYTITACADGEEGLAAVEEGGEFDLIVSDVVMPGMDGPAMARAIRALRPELPILFMSGYAEEQLRRDIDIDRMHFIPKPFSVQQITSKVAHVLGREAAVS